MARSAGLLRFAAVAVFGLVALLSLPGSVLSQAQLVEPVELPGVPVNADDFVSFRELTLQEAMKRVVEFSPQLKAQMAVVEQVKTNTTRAWAMLLPTLDVSGTYTLTDQEIKLDIGSGFADLFRLVALNCGMWDVATMGPAPTLCQTPVEAPAESSSTSSSEPRIIQERHNFEGSVTAAISILNLRTWPNLANVYTAIELAELQKRFSEEQLVFAVVQLYYGIATAQESVRLMKENLITSLRHMEMVDVRFRNGVALMNERVRQAIVVIQARHNLDQSLLALQLARESFALLLGLEETKFRVQESFETPWDGLASKQDLEDFLMNRKDIQLLDKSAIMADRNVDDAWVRFFPVIQGIWRWSISSNKGFGESYDSWRAMVTLSWNIFDGGYRFADLDERRAKLRELRFNREQALIAARQELAKARTEVAASELSLAAGRKTLRLAKENLEIVEKQYQLGAAPQTTVTDAELQYMQARISEVTSRLRLALARVALVKSAGRFHEE